ncbi:hypothetical protein llap_7813 [Limosa lapponica baueri]|uniref:Uncharacterized protein n=1 Tax=Limosa lapponica baueri TaxID=1758121 RepID=A0A2I0U7D8_LIMLA|nr:hypothetical protein llap_7813 [Limosa lapponica baueri]
MLSSSNQPKALCIPEAGAQILETQIGKKQNEKERKDGGKREMGKRRKEGMKERKKERERRKERKKGGRKEGKERKEGRKETKKKDPAMKGYNKQNMNNIELLMSHTTMKTLLFMHLNPEI